MINPYTFRAYNRTSGLESLQFITQISHAKQTWPLFSPLSLLLITLIPLLITHTYSKHDRKTYIVYMGDHPKGINPASLPSLHMTMAQDLLGSHFAPEAILHSYWKSYNGFVMKLTEEEAKTMAGMDGVVSVFPSKKKKLHTTRSWDFISFPQQVKKAYLERDIIVGVIDTGIWPEPESFSDKGFGQPPARWKGSCHNFTCNNKIVGAKYFRMDGKYGKDDIISPRDTNGHGTHCASTAAGNLVSSASLLGLGSGTARGGVPSARIAVYKVSWETIEDADLLAAFDEAIADGVGVISLSIGDQRPILQYFKDANAIGAFHALKNGILTSNAAGNLGPGLYTMGNYAPWLLSVAATTTDRKFSTLLRLGNGLVFEGASVNTFDLQNKYYPLIYAGDVPNIRGGFNSSMSRFCLHNSADKDLVKGKIVLCDILLDDTEGLSSVAAGVVIASMLAKDAPDVYALPATQISEANGLLVHSYLKSTSNPTATISRSNEEKDTSAPYIASFSSRGPNPVTPGILKPDISAPGADIVAAWPPNAPIADVKGDNRKVHYNIMSGTSMACPHVSGAAAYVKSFHPKWSPSAIKSALMTTAVPLSSALNPEAEFAYGAGQINPIKAVNPGFVYDASASDYVKFLCGQGYDKKKLEIITGDNSTCAHSKNQTVWDINLPSFALYVDFSEPFISHFSRTVTNVGSPNSKYKAKVIAPPVLNIEVRPKVVCFTSLGEKKTFTLSVEGKIDVDIVSASLIWDNGKVQVRSPIVVYSHRIAYNPPQEEEATT